MWWWLNDEKGWSYRSIVELFDSTASGVMYGIATAGRELGLVEYTTKGRRRAA